MKVVAEATKTWAKDAPSVERSSDARVATGLVLRDQETVALDGGIIISTPQEASLGVVRKGIEMFKKLNVPILGIMENMSYLTTPNGDRMEIFGHGGGKAEAMRQKIPFLGEIPLFTEIREAGDRGTPIVVSAPNHAASRVFIQMAGTLQKRFPGGNN